MAGFLLRLHHHRISGITSGSHVRPMPQDTRIALFLLAELVAALQANNPDTFKRWLYGGLHTSSPVTKITDPFDPGHRVVR
jgi:hypothetical protein